MKKKWISFIVTTAIYANYCMLPCIAKQPSAKESKEKSTESYVEEMITDETENMEEDETLTQCADRFIIKYKSNVDHTIALQALEEDVVSDTESEDNDCYEVVYLEEPVEISSFVEEILENSTDTVEYVQPDYVLQISEAEENQTESELPDMIAENEEENIKTETDTDTETDTETDSIVALIDTGVDVEHPMLQGHMLEGYNFVEDTTEVYDREKEMEQAHGTHIAGIIASTAPGVQILPLKVFEAGKAYTSDIVKAVQYAEEHGAQIVNMSFGGSNDNPYLKEAMENSSMFFVCAAGNNRQNLKEHPVYPASYGLNNSISVVSVNQDGGMSYFSNYGEESADIAAYGRDVSSCFPENGYGVMNGTSMSAAYVTAGAALAIERCEADQIKDYLKNTSKHLSCLQGKVADGNMLDIDNVVNGIADSSITEVFPEEDFAVDEPEKSSEEMWKLFENEDNIAVSAGEDFTLALKSDGTVWSWGRNDKGQLGDGTKQNSNQPVLVVGLRNIIQISAGGSHALALKSDGSIWSWGSNEDGQLGDGTTNDSRIPIQMPLNLIQQMGSRVTDISAGFNHNLLLTDIGMVWGWGKNACSCIGENKYSGMLNPYPMPDISGISKISAGKNISIFLSSSGAVWARGQGTPGYVASAGSSNSAVNISALKGSESISEGNGTVHAAITSDSKHQIKAWGKGYIGNHSYTEEIWEQPQIVYGRDNADLPAMKSISIGETHTIAVTTSQQAWVWGDNSIGQLGVGSYQSPILPWKVLDQVTMASAGNNFSVFLRTDGTIYACGSNQYGQLGVNRSVSDFVTPIKVTFRNNTYFGNAENVELHERNQGAIFNPGEPQYYKFTPNVSGTYFFGTMSDIDTCGYLYDSDYKQLTSNDDGYQKGGSSNIRDFYFEYWMIKGHTYYIVVRAYQKTVTGAFLLCNGYGDDYSNDIKNAGKIEFQKTLTCKIDYPNDVDIFAFTPAVTRGYSVQAISELDTYGILYDGSGNILTSNDNGPAETESKNAKDFRMRYQLTAGVTYYIAVKANNSETGQVSLIVDYSDDYPGTLEEAFDISNNYCTLGKINYIGDQDMFVFKAKNPDLYIVSVITDIALNYSFNKPYYGSGLLDGLVYETANRYVAETSLLENEVLSIWLGSKNNIGAYKIYVETPLIVNVQ